MSQHDMNLANADGATFRADLNSALQAIIENSSGATAPSTTFAYQWWADTTTGLLKQRNAGNTDWVTVLELSSGSPFYGAGTSGQILTSNGAGAAPSFQTAATAAADGLFFKDDISTVAFVKNGSGLDIKAGSKVWRKDGTVVTYATATAVTLPTMSAGTDYAIYICDDGSIRADANFSAPSGYTTSNARKIGGFHYDLGSAINQYSIWDLKWKPDCDDPRGMVLVANSFWTDIYLCGTDPDVNGTSKNGVTIADGSSPAKIPAAFGGNGSTTYGSFKQYEAHELMAAFGKRLLSYQEFSAAAYGITEAQSVGSDQGTTQRNSGYTSKWGVEQAAGVMWVWGRDYSYRSDGTAWGWDAQTEGRGSIYRQGTYGLVAAILGGNWGYGSYAGSRFSEWYNYPWASSYSIGARGACDHLRLV